MIATLARASIEGTLVVVLVWVVARLRRVSPATRTVLWWCAAAKFVIALVWTAPIEIPVLPGQSRAPVAVADQGTPRSIFEEHALAKTSRFSRTAASGLTAATGFANGVREWASFATIGWILGLTGAVLVMTLIAFSGTGFIRKARTKLMRSSAQGANE